MKLYEPSPLKLIRLAITRNPNNKEGKREAEYLNLINTSIEEVELFIREVITKQNLSPFEEGHKTSIVMRESIGSSNGRSKSISFRGLPPKQTKELLEKEIKK